MVILDKLRFVVSYFWVMFNPIRSYLFGHINSAILLFLVLCCSNSSWNIPSWHKSALFYFNFLKKSWQSLVGLGPSAESRAPKLHTAIARTDVILHDCGNLRHPYTRGAQYRGNILVIKNLATCLKDKSKFWIWCSDTACVWKPNF